MQPTLKEMITNLQIKNSRKELQEGMSPFFQALGRLGQQQTHLVFAYTGSTVRNKHSFEPALF